MTQPGWDQHGFTLIEVIVTIIVSAVLAVLLVQVMSGHITRSYWAVEKMDQGLALHEVMEIINADYRRLLTEDQQPLVTLQNAIDNGGEAGGYWADRHYGKEIKVDRNICINLDQSGEIDGNGCSPLTDTLLKVTISYQEQSLTTLFSR